MMKLQSQLKVLIGIIFALLVVPSGVAFGISFIDLGLMHGGQNSVEVDTGVDAEIDAGDVNADLDQDASATTTTDSSVDISTDVEAEVRSINLIRDQIDVSGEVSIEVTNPQEVDSEASLSAFASSTISADPNIEELVVTDDRIELTYEQQGRLLAFLPVTYSVTAIAHANGEVEVDYPWYTFLVSDNSAEVEAQMESAVDVALAQDADTTADIRTVFTAEESAMVISEMQAVFQNNLQATSTSSGNVNN